MTSTITLPDLIDCHVHFREPGLTHKGDMESESAAAAAGGVRTVCEMPNTVPPTVTVEALAEKVRRADRITACDIRFFMGATEPRHLLAIRDVWRGTSPALQHLRRRCCGLKVYFDHSTGDQGADRETLDEAFRMCGAMGIPLVAHCEDAAINRAAAEEHRNATAIEAHSRRRPPESEIAAVARGIDLARRHGTRFHVAHLSTAGGLRLVRAAKAEGLPVTCEVAPHHLFLTVADCEKLGALGKMNPPLRSEGDRSALWEGIGDGTVDCIATDHAPHTLAEKTTGNPLQAPSGVPGVETMLPLLLTVVAGKWPNPSRLPPPTYHLSPADVARLCFENPNRIFGLGLSADDRRLLIDLDEEWTIHAKHLRSKCGWTPYEGWKVHGTWHVGI